MAYFERLTKRARKRVAGMDEIDQHTQADLGPCQCSRTCLSALEAAMRTGDWNMVADVYVMLEQLEVKSREIPGL
jgi:hypothetical protein